MGLFTLKWDSQKESFVTTRTRFLRDEMQTAKDDMTILEIKGSRDLEIRFPDASNTLDFVERIMAPYRDYQKRRFRELKAEEARRKAEEARKKAEEKQRLADEAAAKKLEN